MLIFSDRKVLHPQSMRPARDGDIPVRVKNSYNPKAPGTLITRARDMSEVGALVWLESPNRTDRILILGHMLLQAVLTSIVLKRNVTMLDIVSTRMLGQVGFLAKVKPCRWFKIPRNCCHLMDILFLMQFFLQCLYSGFLNLWGSRHISGCCCH